MIGPQRATFDIIDGRPVVEGDIVLGPAAQYAGLQAAEKPGEVLNSVTL
jgi:hypothetical protein